ncbi:hypothetical protein C8F01DRAFT_1376416 [Mycena amicta]|nr:hypothetical protein C8F01DRAFT_1376416 [Mycena amicta]
MSLIHPQPILRHSAIPPGLASRLADLQASIAALEAERDSILAEYTPSIMNFASILAEHTPSIRTFAPEIIAEIFLRYIENDSTRGPMHLASVCKRWREIALATPRLWTTVAIPKQFSPARAALLMGEFFQRSGTLPVDLLLEGYRLRKLEIHAKYWEEDGATVQSVPSFPLLEELHLDVSFFRTQSTMLTNLRHSPRLKKATIFTWDHIHSSSILSLPWLQLTTLHIATNLTTHLLESLVEVTNVVDLALLLDEPHQTLPNPHHVHIILPLLQKLAISRFALLGFLTAPALEEFFIARSTCNITAMDIGADSFADASTFLLQFPYLSSVHINCEAWGGGPEITVFFLWLQRSSGDILPHLEALSLKTPSDKPISISSLTRMLRARRHHTGRVGHLNKLSLSSESRRTFFEIRQSLDRLREMRAEGMIFELDEVPVYMGDDLDMSTAKLIMS